MKTIALKRILLAVLTVLAASGCGSNRSLIPGLTDIRGIDLRQYADEGFLITPERYDGDYDALGQIYVFLYPEARRAERRSQRGGLFYGGWSVDALITSAAVDSLYQIAKSWGADAAMNFSVTPSDHPGYRGNPSEPSRDALMGVRVEGFAIRRR